MADDKVEDKVDKSEYEKIAKDNEKLRQDLEDLRMETVSPEYLEFLSTRDKSEKKKDEKPAASSVDDLSKLTPQQAYEKAVKDAEAKIEEKLKAKAEEARLEREADTKKQVAFFAKTHDDFETYRPIMYGLSLDNPDLSLQQLYDKAKSHVKSLKVGATDDDKEKSRRSGTEKPNKGSSGSFDPNKKYTPAEAAEESWKEVVGSGGLQLD